MIYHVNYFGDWVFTVLNVRYGIPYPYEIRHRINRLVENVQKLAICKLDPVCPCLDLLYSYRLKKDRPSAEKALSALQSLDTDTDTVPDTDTLPTDNARPDGNEESQPCLIN